MTLLTVLSHSDLRRVGERAALTELDAGASVQLGRSAPRFFAPGLPWDDRPLDDPFLSRRPCILRAVDGGVEVASAESPNRLVIEGTPVESVVEVPSAALDRGVTLELGEQVALLLHRMPQSAYKAGETHAGLDDADAGAVADKMVGISSGMMDVRGAVERVADMEVPVLVRGESGTGKELVARALHDLGRRRSKPFVAVDLGVLSPTLAAAELFGHAKGAFTGAASARKGFFRAADGGTLFLDEVGEATPEVQAMLLRALETGQVVPVGSHTPVAVDVRLVAATDSDLEARVRRGEFKEPLLHRLAAYVIDLPPLRRRRDDVGRLLVHLARPVLRELGEEHRLDAPAVDGPPWLPAELAASWARAPWTGNIRQLANVVRQCVIDSRGEPSLRQSPRLRMLPGSPAAPESFDGASGPRPAAAPSGSAESERSVPRKRPVFRRPSEVDPDEVENAMRACDFEPAAAARRLRVRRTSMYDLIRNHPRLRLAEDVPDRELAAALAELEGDLSRAARRLGVSRRALGRRTMRSGPD